MNLGESFKDLVDRMESELNDNLEQLDRVYDQGRVDYRLQEKINQLRSSLEAAKKLFDKKDD